MTTAARAKGKSTDPAADVAEVRRGLDLLNVPGGVVEIRALKIPQQGRGKPFTAAGYFTDLDKAAQAAVALDARKAAGVYLVLNETNPALLARSPNQATDHLEPTTSDIDIIRRRWLPLDFDPKRPSGISSTNAEHDAAQAAARECADWLREDAGWPEPILADSGNGWHVLYRVDLPNDEAARRLCKEQSGRSPSGSPGGALTLTRPFTTRPAFSRSTAQQHARGATWPIGRIGWPGSSTSPPRSKSFPSPS